MKTTVCSRSVANRVYLTNHRPKKRKVIMHHTQGGLGFESLILHHTVRTRTRFFMKKGSGTFCLSEVCVCDSNKHPSGMFEQQNRLPGNPKSHDVEFFVSIKDSNGIHVKSP